MPRENVVRAADFLLIHGNGVSEPDKIAEMVQRTRKLVGYTPKPILLGLNTDRKRAFFNLLDKMTGR